MMTPSEAVDLLAARTSSAWVWRPTRCAGSCTRKASSATFIDRNVNYTNFCTEYCTFCAFYRPMDTPKAM